jgi:hypothetical protein
MTDIDWDTELRRIEREFDGLPPEPTPAQLRAKRAAEARERERKAERGAMRGTWARLLLVIVFSASVVVWPYAHSCGLGLLAYAGVVSMIVLGGLWVAWRTWNLRMARAHGLSLLVALWGLMLLGHLVLPRVGYAAVDPANPPGWWCG